MDEMLPRVMLETNQIFLVIFGVLVMVVTVNYWMVIPLVILAFLFYFIRLLYLRTAQNVKRLEGVGKWFRRTKKTNSAFQLLKRNFSKESCFLSHKHHLERFDNDRSEPAGPISWRCCASSSIICKMSTLVHGT